MKEEAEIGKERKVLVPALIEDVKPPLGFGRIHAADLIDWDGDTSSTRYGRLVDDISDVLDASLSDTEIEPETRKKVALRLQKVKQREEEATLTRTKGDRSERGFWRRKGTTVDLDPEHKELKDLKRQRWLDFLENRSLRNFLIWWWGDARSRNVEERLRSKEEFVNRQKKIKLLSKSILIILIAMGLGAVDYLRKHREKERLTQQLAQMRAKAEANKAARVKAKGETDHQEGSIDVWDICITSAKLHKQLQASGMPDIWVTLEADGQLRRHSWEWSAINMGNYWDAGFSGECIWGIKQESIVDDVASNGLKVMFEERNLICIYLPCTEFTFWGQARFHLTTDDLAFGSREFYAKEMISASGRIMSVTLEFTKESR